MYKNGSIVNLAVAKSHGEGESAVSLAAGVCGLVMRGEKQREGRSLYTVDFGAYGQWYCYQEELVGENVEEWDSEDEEEETPRRTEELQEEDTPETPPDGTRERRIESKEEESDIIDFEADLKRRAAEIEKGV